MANNNVNAELEEIKTYFDFQHEVDASKVLDIVEAVGAGWEMPPILVLENEGNGYVILDGHHRAEAAYRHLGLATVKAWVVSVADFIAIVEQHFDGETPNRMNDLDDYISCDGVIYAEMGLR
jgi:hypothetical protein